MNPRIIRDDVPSSAEGALYRYIVLNAGSAREEQLRAHLKRVEKSLC
jgi:hypothetical protein